MVGSAEQVADTLQAWFENEAADGFNVLPPWLPGGLDDFIELVVPILQKRGLFRTQYEGKTLRENLGLPFADNRYSAARNDVPQRLAALGLNADDLWSANQHKIQVEAVSTKKVNPLKASKRGSKG